MEKKEFGTRYEALEWLDKHNLKMWSGWLALDKFVIYYELE